MNHLGHYLVHGPPIEILVGENLERDSVLVAVSLHCFQWVVPVTCVKKKSSFVGNIQEKQITVIWLDANLWYPRLWTREPAWARNHIGRWEFSWCTPAPLSPSPLTLQLQHNHPETLSNPYVSIRVVDSQISRILTFWKSPAFTIVKWTSVSKAQKKHS